MHADQHVESKEEAEGEAGQWASLIPILRNLLHDYDPGVGIAKEFLQNADDAEPGATWIRFALDLRQHPTAKLPNSHMAALSGPALLISSDQTFSSKDLKNIETISEGAKRDEAGKTGRFGLGFNSCYHITDYPCFATRDRIVCFDPHRDVVASKGSGKPGHFWSLKKLSTDQSDWLRAFDIPEGTEWLKTTIFRLPLRTASQAKPERLSERPFTAQQVEELFSELERWGGTLLLFLRNILHLYIDVLHPDGREESRLRVVTLNPDEVQEKRAALVGAVKSDLKTWLHEWRTKQAKTHEALYPHSFRVQTVAGGRDEHFLVAGALLPEGAALLDAAEAMLECHERALPWVGAALPIGMGAGATPKPHVEERLFCTLPLPQRVTLPFFVNGAFDLDSSRTQLTYGARNGNKEVRSRWNRALLTEAAPRVIVPLLRDMRARLGERDPAAFYELWPGHHASGPMHDLEQALYGHLAKEDLLRVREHGTTRWVNAQTARCAPSWSEALRSAFLEDGLLLLDPQPPETVLRGLERASARPQIWQADKIREWLQVASDPRCPLAEAPKRVLRERQLLLELIRLYGSGEKVNRAGLPLALMADGSLRAFARGPTLLLAAPDIQLLLPEARDTMLDATFATEAKLGPDPQVKLVEANLEVVVDKVCAILRPPNNQTWRDFHTNSPSPPSLPWLLAVLRYLSGHNLTAWRNKLRAVSLLPDQHARLHRPDATHVPLYLGDDLPDSLRLAFEAFDVPTLSGPTDLLMLLGLTSSKMASPDAKDLRPPLTVDAVTLWLSAERVQTVEPRHREVLLDWLAAEHARKPLTRSTLDRLRRLPLWSDQHGALTAAEERPLYLSVGHDVPPNLAEYRILQSGSQDQWRPLIRSLGVTELHLSVIIKAIVSDIEKTRDESPVSAGLRWLRDWASLTELEATEGKEVASEVRSLLRSRPIIASTDGRPRSMQDLYNPDAVEALEMLGPIACYPDPKLFVESKEERAKWLQWLALDCAPRPDDVVARIDMLVAQAKIEGIGQVAEPLLRILQYLNDPERWKQLRVLHLHDKRQTMAQYLAALAWLPPIRDAAKRTLAAGFAAPADELRRAADLVPVYLQHQVASQRPLLDASLHSQLGDDLGLPSRVPLRLVIAHLRRVRDLWEDTNHSGLELQRMQDMALEVLARIGQTSPKETAAQDESLVESLRAEPCIWHQETQRFWLPSCVFLQQVPGFEPLRVHLIAADAQRKGLLRLGARESPMSADYLSFLRELAELHLGVPLPDSAKRNVLWAWQRLSETEDGAALRSGPPVLARSGHLLSPAQVLEDDAPWWSNRLKQAELPFLAPGMPLAAARIAGVRSAAGEVGEILLAEGTFPDRAVVTLAEDLQQRISCSAFQRGVLRLLSHAYDLTDIHEASPHVDAALQLRLVPASTMQTALHCAALGRSEPFGEGESDSFLDGNRLLLALDDLEAAAHELAGVLNRRISEVLRLQDLSGLEAIIRCQPGMIEEVLNRRRIKALPVEAPVMDLSDLDPTANAEPSPAERATSPGPLHAPEESTPPIVRPANVAFSEPGARAAGPPLAPGDGTSHVPGQGFGQSHRGWMRSYASYAREGTLAHPLARANNADSNRAAIEYVIEDARSRGWRADGHPGLDVPFDVRIEVPGEDLPRVVVVRGLAGAWDRAGVPLSKTQLLLAREYGERFWLTIVEHAPDQEKRVPYSIQDLFGKLDEIRFDEGWKQAATPPPSQAPAIGDLLYEGESQLGEILDVTPDPPMHVLRIQSAEGEPRELFYNPSLHRLVRKG